MRIWTREKGEAYEAEFVEDGEECLNILSARINKYIFMSDTVA